MSANDLPDAALVDPWLLYEARKRAWIEEHPEPSPEEYSRAMREIADRLGI